MDQLHPCRILIINLDYSLTDKFFRWILSQIPVFDFSGAEFQDNQQKESFAEDGIDCHENHGLHGIPVSLQKSGPRAGYCNISFLSEILNDPIDRRMM